MGYACPVCETPQADAGHLANHLGFTALVRGGDHEAWLDERVPGWSELDEATLAERVVEYADEVEYPQVFEDTTDAGDASGHRHARTDLPVDVDGASLREGGDLDAEDREIVERARELTRRRREDSGDGGRGDSADGRDDDSADGRGEDSADDGREDSETE